MTDSLFQQDQFQPLASRMRPQKLDEYVGQTHLLGHDKVLYRLITNDEISSMIFWGPPGVGKTTLAQLIARQTEAQFVTFSAVTSGIKEIKQVMAEAENNRELGQKPLSLSMKFTASIRHNRMPFYLMWNGAVLF